ncbi:DUF1493 family protein [Pantoea stewartii]|uniref:DUF1493 family protein n=1 Tax=Pantoea stewartii TaxID=66269 RepID=UPI0006D0D3CE|nr:DUF1493 family protein [Pantoea stewartii]
MEIENDVLEFFRSALSIPLTWKGKKIILEMDTVLQDYAELDELPYAIDDYSSKFNVDISNMNIESYYPNVKRNFLARIFNRRAIEEEINHLRKPLTVRMFAESAKAGRWIYE